MKVGDLIIRYSDGMLAMVVGTERLHVGLIRVQYYAVPEEAGYGGWHCDDVASSWRLQNEI